MYMKFGEGLKAVAYMCIIAAIIIIAVLLLQ
jgi:hypothetical protein